MSEQKKAYLRRYKKNIELIDRLKDKLEMLNERLITIKSPNYSGMPRGGTPVTQDDLISEIMELEDRIKRLKDKSRKLKVEILSKIDEIEDSRYAEILESYFIDRKDFSCIAEDMGYNIRHVIRLYTEAINIMSL
jgi:hypothetical protein